MATAEQLAWAGGLFEGEGCFYADRHRGAGAAVGASIRMKEKETIERFAAIIGFGNVTGPTRTYGGKSGLYQWKVTGSAVAAFYQLVCTWLSDRRRKAFFDALDERRDWEATHSPRKIVRLQEVKI